MGMTLKIVAAGVVLALGASVSAAAFAQAKPDVLVKQRQAAMTLQGKYLGPIGAMLKGSAPYNADIVARNATFLENLARMPWDGFDASTKGEKSRTKPEAYTDPKFKAPSSALRRARRMKPA
jgi:cytochrome c556